MYFFALLPLQEGEVADGMYFLALFWNVIACILSALHLQLTVSSAVFQHVFLFMDGCFPGEFVSTCFRHKLCGSCHLCELKIQTQL